MVDKFRSAWWEMGGWMLFALIFALTQYLLCLYTGRTTVAVSVEAMQPTVFKLYWATKEGGFKEKNSVSVALVHGSNRFKMTIPSLAATRTLRIDPLNGPGTLSIRRMVFTQSFLEPVVIDFQAYLKTNASSQGLSALSYDSRSGLRMQSDVVDPWFILIPGSQIDLEVLALWIVIALAAGAMLHLLLASKRLKGGERAGLLRVEVPTCPDPSGNRWLGALQEALPDLHLHRTMIVGDRYVYQFSFTTAKRQDPALWIDSLHREYPYLRFLLQMHRSGHVC